MRKHSDIGDIDLTSISIIKDYFDHVVLDRDVKSFNGGRKQAVVDRAPEDADASAVGKLMFGLGLDVKDLHIEGKIN